MASQIKRLVRPLKGRKIAGVAMGLANYTNTDVTLWRLLWVVALLPGGLPGLCLYVVCWLVIPEGK